MVRDAEQNAGEDKKRRELIEARNQTDGLIYSTEKSLKENGDKLSAEDRSEIEEAIDVAKKAMEGEDATALLAGRDRLQQAAMKIGEALYKAGDAAAGGSDAPGDGNAQAQDGVVDADFEEVDDNKKSA